jgi:hypothetical protein
MRAGGWRRQHASAGGYPVPFNTTGHREVGETVTAGQQGDGGEGTRRQAAMVLEKMLQPLAEDVEHEVVEQ